MDKPQLFPTTGSTFTIPDSGWPDQNFKKSSRTCAGHDKNQSRLEDFCTEGDPLWKTRDEELIQLAGRELEQIGLCSAATSWTRVVRVPKAYPIYKSDYREALAAVREFVDGLENFRTIGRNGLHRYDNQDHAMLTGMLAVRSMVLGERHDLWEVNADREYHEEVRGAGRTAPEMGPVEKELTRVFMRIDRVALGLAAGAVGGLGLSLATLVLILRGGPVIGPTLGLLGQYFPGYSVTAWGSLVGLFYGYVSGFALGWLFATLRNAITFMCLVAVYRSWQLRRIFDCW